ncbi:MAG: macro domain-containing protein [Planctomycetes bacterium]|nr:macro domain-containing protein [Planctomycetota bacterium]
MPNAKSIFVGSRELRILAGDITKETTDAIVNAANEHLAHGGGVARAINDAAGEDFERESALHPRVPTGSAGITGAGRLPCKRVIHAVGPIWGQHEPAESDRLLRSAVTSSLVLANLRKLKSISFPAISTGIYGFPVDRAAQVMLQAAKDFLGTVSSVNLAQFVLFSERDFETFANALDTITQ